MAKVVRIENPIAGCRPETTPNRARRFVRSGRAVFVGAGETCIRFVSEPAAAVMAVRAMEVQIGRLESARGYDSYPQSCYDRARHIPVIQPEKLIRESGDEIEWSFRAGVNHRMRRDQTAEEVAAIRAS